MTEPNFERAPGAYDWPTKKAVVYRALLIMILALAIGGSVLAARLVGRAASPAAPLPKAHILFSRGGDLYVAGSDGLHPRRLVRNASEVAVSPDARSLAFTRDGAVWLMRRDGSDPRQLTKLNARPSKRRVRPPEGDSGPSWSPDGTGVYFSRWSYASFTSSIFAIRPGATGLRRLTRATPTEDGHCQANTAPSPDGKMVVFAESYDCGHGSDVSISAITPGGRQARLALRMGNVGGIHFDPAWAPHGFLLAYGVLDTDAWPSRTGESGIYVASATSRPLRVAAAVDVGSPAWSPDGQWIAFTRAVVEPSGYPGAGDVWLVRRDGTGLRQVTRGKPDDSDPAWLPAPS